MRPWKTRCTRFVKSRCAPIVKLFCQPRTKGAKEIFAPFGFCGMFCIAPYTPQPTTLSSLAESDNALSVP